VGPKGDGGKGALELLRKAPAVMAITILKPGGFFRGEGPPEEEALHQFPHNMFRVGTAAAVTAEKDLAAFSVTIGQQSGGGQDLYL
jgi:hypothetical protein